ncbi:PREDICTED: PH and SEC7 domain-containing protein 4-like [Nanorana parkeri]|uniref:PH and SEC7 domain-containing protein 4-like n=1 Tax=Nanorana parkeri TaxID=125878 RepID=UPI000854E215|nr:PREDICTED: PH and SEC7 domain-containing protein 4-like [Nanorana parkeri]
MEKKQLSVDDDLLPIYYVHSGVEDKTFSRVCQGHEASVPSPHFNHFPSFNENCLPPGPSRTERSVLNNYDYEGQKEVNSVGFTPGTNVEDCCASNAYSKVPMVSDFHQSHKATNMRTQVSSTSKCTTAQDVFLASLLQVQLCVMDLQDQIEMTETNHKARDIGLKMSTPMGQKMSLPSVLEPEIRPTCIEDVVRNPEPPCVDEDQESDDTAYSELEVEERLFCDNPLFKNSKGPRNVDYNVQTSITELTSQHKPAPMDRIVNEGSQLLKQNAWDSKDMGTGTVVWHRIIREESLEELQIYEDEWEEKRSMLCNTGTSGWPVSNNLPGTQTNPLCLTDPPAQIAVVSSLPNIPVTSPCKEEPGEEAGLLFSDSSYWTKYLIPDEQPEHQVPTPSTSYNQESTPPPREEPREKILLNLCQGEGNTPYQEIPREEKPLDPFQGEGTLPPQKEPKEDILLDPFQGEGTLPPQKEPKEDILLDPFQGEGTLPPRKEPKEDILLDQFQGEGALPPRELPRGEILLDLCQGEGTPPPRELPRGEILLDLCQGEGTHPMCQGCQGKEHGSKVLPSESASEALPCKQQQDTPAIIIEQLDDVSTDLETSGSEEVTYVEAVANAQDVEAARCLAMKLFHLDGFDRSQVAPYLQKNNDFSAMVAEEYLALFDFNGKSLAIALRSLLQELVLTGETQERERVLYHFSKRFHSCNPKEYGSADAVHTLTCALMLLNSDLHGQNIGKSMTAQEFINNLEGMNDDGNFTRELLKSLYHSIRTEKLEWAMSEEKLANVLIARPDNLLSVRKKSNPFVDLPAPDPQAPVYKQGMLCRKVHADIDGKKTPWGKRRWKSFHTALKGMLLFFLKDEYRADFQFPEEVISIHHALAERASDYTKKPNVFRLQTADWRVFLFQAQTSEEMNSWISRINLVAAMFSSPPFPAAVGSQRRFYRPILPLAQSKLDLEEQLQSHETLMDKFTDDLTEHQRNLPDPKSKSRESEDYHLREEYLRYEKMRYETYVKLLAIRLESGCEDLLAFESRLTEPDGGQGETTGLKRSYSSPSLIPESSPVVVKVKRNISERRTYRRIIPKRNKNLV